MATSPQEFGATFKSFMDRMVESAPPPEAPVLQRLAAHFGGGVESLPIVSDSFATYDHANVQASLDARVGAGDHAGLALGVHAAHKGYMGLNLADLVLPDARMGAAQIGPVEYTMVRTGPGDTRSCIQSGLLLFRDADEPLACLVQGPGIHHINQSVRLDVMARTPAIAQGFLASVRRQMLRQNVYRGKVLSLSYDQRSGLTVTFHSLPPIDRASIILPAGILERVERQTIGFSTHAEKLLAAGRHLRRGLLLFGPPGTGKTLTAMYLATHMAQRTVLLVTGREQGLIQDVCAMARYLQPATVILEDVDLIAESRDIDNGRCTGPLMFELLNEMDGLSPDHDIIFLLTTNRADRLEPALASRPGRIDQAIEIPLPDAACRERLLDLYQRGVITQLRDRAQLIAKTDGASAAFIKELVRRATLFACDDTDPPVVADAHFHEALHELLIAGGRVTKSMLGFSDPSDGSNAPD